MTATQAERKPPRSANEMETASGTDVFMQMITDAVREALSGQNAVSNRRLLSVEEAAQYLACSKREIFYMIQRGELHPIKHGRKTVLDVQDLDEWIDQAKRRFN